MIDSVRFASEIPDAPYYVCANDRFLSGWGPAQGKTNTVIFPCSTMIEVHRMMSILEARNDMRYVRVCYTKPRLKARGYFYQVLDGKDWS
jgi:hypothetical protein